jgi:hypothetical protein|tara:strand:- start:234 stop:401 length:168 start_codon:yes stop_codon:yes gene_type:complete
MRRRLKTPAPTPTLTPPTSHQRLSVWCGHRPLTYFLSRKVQKEFGVEQMFFVVVF